MNKIKILLADDHRIILDGIKLMLDEENKYEICGMAANGEEALQMAVALNPDIIIADISMPDINGIQLIEKIKELKLSAKIIVLSMYAAQEYVCNALKVGANAYLTKQYATRNELLEAINNVLNDEEYFSSNIAKIMIKNYSEQAKKRGSTDIKTISLTSREKEIIKLYVDGYSNQEIADLLVISTRTVDAHKNNIMQKFSFKSTVEMVKYAIRNNIVDI